MFLPILVATLLCVAHAADVEDAEDSCRNNGAPSAVALDDGRYDYDNFWLCDPYRVVGPDTYERLRRIQETLADKPCPCDRFDRNGNRVDRSTCTNLGTRYEDFRAHDSNRQAPNIPLYVVAAHHIGGDNEVVADNLRRNKGLYHGDCERAAIIVYGADDGDIYVHQFAPGDEQTWSVDEGKMAQGYHELHNLNSKYTRDDKHANVRSFLDFYNDYLHHGRDYVPGRKPSSFYPLFIACIVIGAIAICLLFCLLCNCISKNVRSNEKMFGMDMFEPDSLGAGGPSAGQAKKLQKEYMDRMAAERQYCVDQYIKDQKKFKALKLKKDMYGNYVMKHGSKEVPYVDGPPKPKLGPMYERAMTMPAGGSVKPPPAYEALPPVQVGAIGAGSPPPPFKSNPNSPLTPAALEYRQQHTRPIVQSVAGTVDRRSDYDRDPRAIEQTRILSLPAPGSVRDGQSEIHTRQYAPGHYAPEDTASQVYETLRSRGPQYDGRQQYETRQTGVYVDQETPKQEKRGFFDKLRGKKEEHRDIPTVHETRTSTTRYDYEVPQTTTSSSGRPTRYDDTGRPIRYDEYGRPLYVIEGEEKESKGFMDKIKEKIQGDSDSDDDRRDSRLHRQQVKGKVPTVTYHRYEERDAQVKDRLPTTSYSGGHTVRVDKHGRPVEQVEKEGKGFFDKMKDKITGDSDSEDEKRGKHRSYDAYGRKIKDSDTSKTYSGPYSGSHTVRVDKYGRPVEEAEKEGKGFLEKIKEKVTGDSDSEDEKRGKHRSYDAYGRKIKDSDTSNTYSGPYSGSHTVRVDKYGRPVEEAEKEGKGFLEKIKEKVTGDSDSDDEKRRSHRVDEYGRQISSTSRGASRFDEHGRPLNVEKEEKGFFGKIKDKITGDSDSEDERRARARRDDEHRYRREEERDFVERVKDKVQGAVDDTETDYYRRTHGAQFRDPQDRAHATGYREYRYEVTGDRRV